MSSATPRNVHPSALLWALIAVVGTGRAQQLVATPAPAEAQLSHEQVRASCLAIEHLTDWWYGRDPQPLALARLATTQQSTALLADADGRVRAMAIVLLFEQLGHRALPLVAPLLEDAAPALPRREHLHGPPLGAVDGPPPYEERPQTVGSIASAVIGSLQSTAMQLSYVGGDRRIDERVMRRAYLDYLESRHDRPWSWLRIACLATRLHGGVHPLQPERLPELLRLRAEVERAPVPARSWYLLGLGCDWRFGDEQVVGVADRVAALRAIEVGAVLRFLDAQPPIDPLPTKVDPKQSWPDPDVTAAKFGAYPWQAVAQFAIEHGDQWLPADRLDDWAALAESHHAKAVAGRTIGGGQYPLPLAGWWTTLARIDPSQATRWIDRGFAVLRAPHEAIQRGQLAFAAMQLLGDEGLRRAVEWFFVGESTRLFDDQLGKSEGRALLAAILTDARLEGVAPDHLQGLALACNAQCGGQSMPFGSDEAHDLQHPMGIVGYSRDPAAAAAKWPVQSQALATKLTEWRSRLRTFATERLR